MRNTFARLLIPHSEFHIQHELDRAAIRAGVSGRNGKHAMASLYAPSSGLNRAVRWFGRGLWVLMTLSVIAAVTWGSGLSKRNDKLAEDNKKLAQALADLKHDSAQREALDDPETVALRKECAAVKEEKEQLERDWQALRERLAGRPGNEAELTALHARISALEAERNEANAQARASGRAAEVARGENDVLRAERDSALEDVKVLRALLAAASGGRGALDDAIGELIAAPMDAKARQNVADRLRDLPDGDALASLTRYAADLDIEPLLWLIVERHPEGGERLIAELMEKGAARGHAGALLAALDSYPTAAARDLLAALLADAQVDALYRVRAACSLAFAGDARADGALVGLYRLFAPGEGARDALISLAQRTKSAAHLGAAEAALLDALATQGERERAEEAFRTAAPDAARTRLKLIIDNAAALHIDEDRVASLKRLAASLGGE